jgi:serine/threonine-protein kinase
MLKLPVAQIHEFGDFRLDTGRRLLLGLDGQSRPLSPKAFDTLLYLVEHPDVLLDKEVLMQALWPDTAVEENNLNQNISILRRILGGDRHPHRYILTVTGHGYRFIAKVKTLSANPPAASPAAIRSLAVLPFQPLVAEDRDSSLEIGMADTLIARLSSIRGVVVRPFGAVRRFAHPLQDVLSAGRELDVQSVLEGSLQRSGGKIRVNTRLLDVASGACLWAGTFDEPFTDIFALQDAISERVVQELAIKLTAADKDRLTKHHTENSYAYQLYLKGRFYWWSNDPIEFAKCRDYFQQSVALDPSYALGHCGLNSYYGFGAAWGILNPADAWPIAEHAITTALALDDSLSEAHLGFAALKMVYYLDWSAAETHARRAIDLNPNFDEAYYLYSFFLGVMRRWDEAIAAARQALKCSPLSPRILQHLGSIFFYARRFPDAMLHYEQVLQLDPRNAAVHDSLGDLHYLLGQNADAAEHWRKSALLQNDLKIAELFGAPATGAALSHAVHQAAAIRLQSLQEKQQRGEYVPAIHSARLYFRAGDLPNAFRALATACEERNVFALMIVSDPLYDPLRADVRFSKLLQRMKLQL